MTKTKYVEAEQEVYDLMGTVIEEHFPEIEALGKDGDPLRIKVWMVESADEEHEGPVLKHHGAHCAGMISKSSPKDRAGGGPDVVIEVDAFGWEESSERRRMAILAHELNHVDFKRGKQSELKRDVYGRPRIKFRPDDWILTGFRIVCEWYAEDAVEYQCVRSVQGALVQLGLGFMEPGDLAESPKRARGRRAAMVTAV